MLKVEPDSVQVGMRVAACSWYARTVSARQAPESNHRSRDWRKKEWDAPANWMVVVIATNAEDSTAVDKVIAWLRSAMMQISEVVVRKLLEPRVHTGPKYLAGSATKSTSNAQIWLGRHARSAFKTAAPFKRSIEYRIVYPIIYRIKYQIKY